METTYAHSINYKNLKTIKKASYFRIRIIIKWRSLIFGGYLHEGFS